MSTRPVLRLADEALRTKERGQEMKHLKVTVAGEETSVNHFITTDENAAVVMADFKEGDMIAIENYVYSGNTTVKESITIMRVSRIVAIEIRNR
jgi:co-chaperonin GroES (HSP10)